ncbi:hypothetical protein, partial [Vibrio aestuarianus]
RKREKEQDQVIGINRNERSQSPKYANTLRHQIWFIDRCETLLERHTPEYFDEYISPSMRFTFGLVRYVETANPEMYREAQQVLLMSQEEEE